MNKDLFGNETEEKLADVQRPFERLVSPLTQTFNEDCMVVMARSPDKYFDLAVVDPPYGIGADKKNSGLKLQSKHSATVNKDYGSQKWDDEIPNEIYFCELMRVSKEQIVWGANYYGLIGGMIYWRKNVTMPTYSRGEIAYCSKINRVDEFEYTWHGMLQGNMKDKEERIHPTQKPVALYDWIFKNYAERGQKILDTHLGSGSSRIAAYKAGLDFTGCELDKDYFEAQEARFKIFVSQQTLF